MGESGERRFPWGEDPGERSAQRAVNVVRTVMPAAANHRMETIAARPSRLYVDRLTNPL